MENGLNLKDRNQILQIQSGLKKNGLAFVDSSSVTGKPDRFTSIPEAWSFGSTVMINQRRYDKYGSSQKSDAIAILKEKRQQPLEQLRHIGNRQCLSITPKQYQGSLLSCLFLFPYLTPTKKILQKKLVGIYMLMEGLPRRVSPLPLSDWLPQVEFKRLIETNT